MCVMHFEVKVALLNWVEALNKIIFRAVSWQAILYIL